MKKFFLLLFVLLYLSTSVMASEVKVPVLLYHNVTEREIPDGELMHISPGMLEEHFKALTDNGYKTISMSEYYDYCVQKKPIPSKSIIITFDDGYISNYKIAYPLLKKYNMKATYYIITNSVGASNLEFPHFTWENAIEMEKSGLIEIESHSATHPNFSNLTYEQTVIEMRLSKYAIETKLNKKCRFFAYPYGATNMSSSAVAAVAPYEMASIVTNNGYADDNDCFNIPRHTISGKMSGEQLIDYIRNI